MSDSLPVCRYCDKPIPVGLEVKTYAYWSLLLPIAGGGGKLGQTVHYSHRECKVQGAAQEAWDCQNIDADCNDCKYYKRGKLVGVDIFDGHCLKFDKPTHAQPNKCTMHNCFEHRRIKPQP